MWMHVESDLRSMQMDPLLQAAPDQCRALAAEYEGRGETYQGFCAAGAADGHGEWRKKNGNTYVGEWHEGLFHGHGTCTGRGGYKHVGNWKANLPHGQGTRIYSDGRTYEGEWHEGQFHGWGPYARAVGAASEGTGGNLAPWAGHNHDGVVWATGVIVLCWGGLMSLASARKEPCGS
jgi:hypothetical protein